MTGELELIGMGFSFKKSVPPEWGGWSVVPGRIRDSEGTWYSTCGATRWEWVPFSR